MTRIVNIESVIDEFQTMCDDINNMFGLSVSVSFNPVLQKVYDRYMTDPEPENVSRETTDDNPEPVDIDTTDDNEKDGENNDTNS